ncbi:MAG: tetratricopeptide repeat protein, partial [Candidatus Krumholzibacteria bacterium]|nr:tetratricopeptide repeat protein [Candidatus Krumholzibacteria bacterium]
VILIDEAGDADGAARFLEKALDHELSGSSRTEALYYLGKAHLRKYEITGGVGNGGERKKALDIWLKLARESAGTDWGERAHRAYLEQKFAELKTSERLVRLDEYLGYYGTGEGRWWALSGKVDFLYGLARDGKSWAVDSALAVSGEVLGGDASAYQKKRVALKRGYLCRMKGDLAGAAGAFESFVSTYGDDPRVKLVLYDLGETRLKIKDCDRARAAYASCLEKRPRRSLAGKCALRLGDCFYYMRRFEEAAEAYNEFVRIYPDSDLSAEAAFREALALERLGRGEGVDAALARLAERKDLAVNLRVRVLRKLGSRMLGRGDIRQAAPLLIELVSRQRTAGNLLLLADALFGSGEYGEALKGYSDAIKFDGADTCRALAGMAKARFRLKEFKKAGRDLEKLVESCPGFGGVAGVLIVKGMMEVSAGQCSQAEKTLSDLREKYADMEESPQAL